MSPRIRFLGVEHGEAVAFGTVATSEYDNPRLAWIGSRVHPDHRRRGLGSEMMEAVIAEAEARGRTSFGADAWVSEPSAAFAARHGFEPRSKAINRRQVLAEVDFAELRARYEEALPLAEDYELVRRFGATPDDQLDAVAEMTAAINDAPTDDLDIEDEVFPPDRIRAYEMPSWLAVAGSTGFSPGTGTPVRSPVTASWPSTASGRSGASSTTPPSSPATVATAWASCSRSR